MAAANNSIDINESVLSQDNNFSDSQMSFLRLKPDSYRVLDYEFITGWRRNSTILVAENHFYGIKKNNKLGASWLCTHRVANKSACNVRVYMVENRCIQLSNAGEHKHADKREEKGQLNVLNEIKRRCGQSNALMTTTQVTVRDIYNQVLLE